MTPPEDAKRVLDALRLGWYVADVRGRNRPDGPPGTAYHIPDRDDRPLPLRVERTATEQRRESQAVLLELAGRVGYAEEDLPDFRATLESLATGIAARTARGALDALRRASRRLEAIVAGTRLEDERGTLTIAVLVERLTADVADQARRVERCEVSLVARTKAHEAAEARVTAAENADQPLEQLLATAHLAEAAHAFETERVENEKAGYDTLRAVLGQLTDLAAKSGAGAGGEGDTRLARSAIEGGLAKVAEPPAQAWTDLSDLIWRFDARMQDQLAADSETVASAYQLGRGLAETYWALDHYKVGAGGSQAWGFLLGKERCKELARLVGRLAAYLTEYTAPAIVSSIEVWKDAAAALTVADDTRRRAAQLYEQLRRWYELIVVGQDPTTLVRPTDVLRNWRAVGRFFRLFWLQLVALGAGLAGLGWLLFTLSEGGSGARVLTGVLAALGVSLATITGLIKNSAQAMLKRLRQDAYTDLVAVAVIALPAPRFADFAGRRRRHQAIGRRSFAPDVSRP